MPTAVAIQCVEVTTPKVPSISGRVVKGLGLILPAMTWSLRRRSYSTPGTCQKAQMRAMPIAPMLRFRSIMARMPDAPGPQLLRHWIERAAARDPDKAFIVAADDGRTLSYGQLRGVAGRIATYLRGQRYRRERSHCAPVEQLDRASRGLFRCAGLWRHDLHRPCRDEPQSARQHPAGAQARMVLCEEGLGLDDILAAAAAPSLPLGNLG